MTRPRKEMLKNILFGIFPGFFKDWAVYHNWKNSLIYRPGKHVGILSFIKDFFSNKYHIPIPAGKPNSPVTEEKDSLAVVIHVFYPEIFREILKTLAGLMPVQPLTMKLFITTTPELQSEINTLLANNSIPYTILIVENRGRDILPFIKILPQVIQENFGLILKLHTKKSNHLNRQRHWRDDLLSALISPENFRKNIEIFNSNPAVGIIGPYNHILPMYLYYGANAEKVTNLSERMNVPVTLLPGISFAAGSMFFARTKAMMPVYELNLTDAEFEPEQRQVDGTMAHAIERFFSISAMKQGLMLADTKYNPKKPMLTVTRNHYFSV